MSGIEKLRSYLTLVDETKCSRTYRIDRSRTPELEFINDMKECHQHKFLDTITLEKDPNSNEIKIRWTMLNGASFTLTQSEYKDGFLSVKFRYALEACGGLDGKEVQS